MKSFIFLFFLVNFVSAAPSKSPSLIDNEVFVSCLEQFYAAAYNENYDCTKNFDYFSETPNIKNEAFTSAPGASCVLEVVKEECSKSEYTLFKANYDKFSQTLTETPAEGGSCTNAYYRFNAMKCTPLLTDFSQQSMAMAVSASKKLNESLIDSIIELCHNIEVCMSPECYFPDLLKKPIADACEALALKNTPFEICLKKFEKHPPKSSKYPCLEGEDFNSAKIEIGIKMLTEKKECTKIIMKDVCGEESLVDFDKNSEIAVRSLKMAQQLTSIIMSD